MNDSPAASPDDPPEISSANAVNSTLSGWGNYPKVNCTVHFQRQVDVLRNLLVEGNVMSSIPRGLGRSYGDSSVNQDGVLVQTPRNRLLALDEQTGCLTCEAGVSLEEVIQCVLPKGWFLPTTPGTKFVTIGGAIAADVHGKNHHRDGTWGQHVKRLSLMVADGTIMECSAHQNSDVFWATVGGMGLTGIVLEATIQLMRVPSAYVEVTQRRASNLFEAFDLFLETDEQYKYSVAWIDCLSSRNKLGRSVLLSGNDAEVTSLKPKQAQSPWKLPAKRAKSVPFEFPGMAMNQLAIRAFNGLYYRKHGNRQMLMDFDSYFYPLDSINHWNRIYGKRGFVQYQALFPRDCSREAMVKLLQIISKSGQASFLAVLKSSGPANPGMLSYLFDGHTLALDFPFRGEKTIRLCHQLDQVMLEFGGRVYLAKDALIGADTFAAMYPRLDEFKQLKHRLDPLTKFRSCQSDRVGITEPR
ncbi:MAG: FAD-binding protein [Pirellulaceae bacterium]